MVSNDPAALRSAGVRLRIFLVAVIGVFIATVLALLITLQNLVGVTEGALRRQRAAAASVVFTGLASTDGTRLYADAEALRARLDLMAIEVRDQGLAPVRVGAPRTRREVDLAHGEADRTVVAVFAPTGVDEVGRNVRTFVTAGMGATILAGLFLVFYVMSMSRPVEVALRGEGGPRERDPTAYLIDTFKTSLTTLKSDATELRRLRDVEKVRADELARVTATLVRSLTSGFIGVDADGRVVDLNVSAREILGLDPDVEPAGREARAVLGPSPFALELERAVMERATLQRTEVAGGGGGAEMIGLSTVPLLDDQGSYLGMLALFTDLTPIHRLEQRVRDMQNLADLGEMSAGIAHEFRNSLSTILGYLRLAGKDDVPAQTRERLRHAATEAEQLTDAVERLLTFARPLRPQSHAIDVSELVQSIAERLQPVSRNVRFDLQLEPFEIEGDTALLARAFENVLRNAVESIQQKGSPGTVTVRSEPATKSIRISDDGMGLDPADASRLFLPFQSNKPGGFGLGLALARKIVLVHGGTISLTGAPGAGATTTIAFTG